LDEWTYYHITKSIKGEKVERANQKKQTTRLEDLMQLGIFKNL